LADEVRDVSAAGARHIQLDEPAILGAPADVPLLARALAPIAASKGPSELTLATYFGDVAPIFDELQDLPCDTLALDLASSPTLGTRLRDSGARKRLALGVLDGRNTRLEDVDTVAADVSAILARLQVGPVYLTTSCGLEYLPRAYARRKLARLSEIRRAVVGGGA
jgi:5-methyltetrahydropteroyltriglutamate--homocysteine methyltransferase